MSLSADPAPILDLIEAFRRSKTMFAALRLGVFDRLEREPQTAAMLAAELKLDAGALARLLNGCVALGLVEHKDQRFRNSPAASKYLASASPDTLSGYIAYSDQSLYSLWAHLDDAVREGTNRWAQTFGSRDALFDYYFRDPGATANFLGGMHGMGLLTSPHIVRAFDLSRFTHLVDLGGATGHLAIAACEAFPNLRATVFDLAQIEPFARAYLERSAVSSRVEFLSGDFFTDPLPAGDLYVLGRILHDWSDEKIRHLLEKICAQLPHDGGLLIAEAVLDADQGGPLFAVMQDLNMLVCTDGRERTCVEYSALLQASGFSKIESHHTGSLLDAVLALKD